jgi:transcriptional regulator with XRE-family HTH domain
MDMPTPIRQRVSRNIRYLKARDELRFADIAEAVGVRERQVQDWTSDKDWGSNPSDEKVLALAKLFGVEAGYFYNDNPESRGA